MEKTSQRNQGDVLPIDTLNRNQGLDGNNNHNDNEPAYEDPNHARYVNEAELFATPLPLTGERKTTTRLELWVSCRHLRIHT